MRSVRDKLQVAVGRWRLAGNSLLTLFVILYSLFPISVSAQDFHLPEQANPPHLVNDFANMLSPDEVSALEQKLLAYSDSTSTQIAIVTINSLEGGDIAQYSTELHHKWGIGQKGKDNGVLILIAKQEHKVFISTGRGVEANLPDIIALRIVEHTIRPQFKAGRYYAGINAATDEIIARLSGQFVNDKPDTDNPEVSPESRAKVIAFIIFFIILVIIAIIRRGGGGGQTLGGSSGLWFLTGLLGGMGSSGGDGGGGGGGFGGFGGGDSGGGGAGGSW